MANTYCTATSTGKGFFTHEDRNNFYLSGHAGDVWVVGNNAAGVSWINRVSGTAKVKAEAQAIVDGKIEEAQATWDALSEEDKAQNPNRPIKYILPQELTMATYKGIKGIKVVTKATDPSASTSVGTMWYNSTSPAALKYSIEGTAAWAAGTATNQARAVFGSAVGTATAALVWGDDNAPTNDLVETWNGSAWTETGDLLTGRNASGAAGTNTAALAFGGHNTVALTENWNGSSWTEVADLNTGRGRACGSLGGSTTAALFCGGQVYPTIYAITETWNGSSWSEVGNLTTAVHFETGIGTSTAMLCIGGRTTPSLNPPSMIDNVQLWNGSSWTEVNDMNAANSKSASTASGTTTAGMIAGGETTAGAGIAVCEMYNGTSWTEVADLANARYGPGGAGTTTSALAIDGKTPNMNTVEEWADPVYTIKTVTVS